MSATAAGSRSHNDNNKRIRPWDRRRPHLNLSRRAAAAAPTTTPPLPPPPSVTVQNQTFYSDRFYLMTSIYDDDDDDNAASKDTTASTASTTSNCQCGYQSPPPLLDRSALIGSLDLTAAIFATYSVHPQALRQSFPSLFGPNANIPTLILHGQKGWQMIVNNHNNSPQQQQPQQPTDESQDSEDDDDDDTTDTSSLATQQEDSNPQEQPLFPDTVFFSEILPCWIPPHSLSSSQHHELLDENGCLTPGIVELRQSKRGVHHPKYMILLETSGSIVVLVSTANLTASRSTDAVWVQRFPPRMASSSMSSTKNKNDTPSSTTIGTVLVDMLFRQTLATATEQLTPLGFVQRYVGWKNLTVLERNYDYSQAQVHMIATVPGDFDDTNFGRQRMAHILQQQQQQQQSVHSPHDRLVMQPTSLGGEWTRASLTHVVQSYLVDDDHDHDRAEEDQQDCLERVDIVWPTEDFMQSLVHHQQQQPQPHTSIRDSPDSVTTTDHVVGAVATHKYYQGYLFLSSETFNTIDVAVLSRMAIFEPSVPEQRPGGVVLTPHFKSVARVMNGKNEYQLRKQFGHTKAEHRLSWFLLTSACLSRGAQGVRVEHTTTTTRPHHPPVGPSVGTTISYSNFELGVLFCSQLQGRTSDRLYCFKPAQCICPSSSSSSSPSKGRMIHLPVPYCLKPELYQQNEDELDFCETPYFHEIPKGSGCVGHMRMTPYGAALAAKYHMEQREL